MALDLAGHQFCTGIVERLFYWLQNNVKKKRLNEEKIKQTRPDTSLQL